MKNRLPAVRRCLCAALILALALPGLSAAARVTDVTVFIPDRVEDLQLTPLPEIPEAPEFPELTCELDQLELGDPCPVIADPDGEMTLHFSPAVSQCIVDSSFVPIDENGNGRIALEDTRIQNIRITATYKNASFSYLASGRQLDVTARYGNMTVYYDRYGKAYRVIVTESTDWFLSGQSVTATAETLWLLNENQTVSPLPGGKVRKDGEPVWYVDTVIVTYGDDTPLMRVIAEYLNDAKHSLIRYEIVYNHNFEETPYTYTVFEEGNPVERTGIIRTPRDRYLINYAGSTYQSGGVTYEEDDILGGMYENLEDDTVTIVDDVELDGTVYLNASGQYFGSDRWLELNSLRPYRGRKKLLKLFDFISIRREEP